MSNIRSESVDRLFQIILSLESKEDCYAFFEDVCTIKEVQDMAQRLDAAFLLDEGMEACFESVEKNQVIKVDL